MTDGAGAPVALVTGGSRGIGKAIVEALAADGHRVAVVATSESSAELGAEAARAAGAEALAFAGDVADPARAQAIVAAVMEAWGRIDVLVNNAGVTRDTVLMRMSDEVIDAVIDTNLKGALYYCRAVAKPMMKARSGNIVNISSIVGIKGNAGQSNYAAAKAGIFGVTRSLAAELGGRGIRVNAIAPGYIQTDMTANLPDAIREASLAAIPLGRLGDAEDIARGVSYLVSDAAAYVTGTTLVIDGGMSL
jgi:3-oxoacyl-[acyl-carrier protein] reductase